MFSSGQWIFALVFFVIFAVVMVYSYLGDKKLHKKQYKGNIWVLVGFIAFIVFLILMKTFLKGN